MKIKLILYSLGALLFLLASFVYYRMFKRKTPVSTEEFLRKIDDAKIRMHQEAAKAARQEANKHEEKAEELALKPAPVVKITMTDAISSWNDDTL
jgi:hypothetical protein